VCTKKRLLYSSNVPLILKKKQQQQHIFCDNQNVCNICSPYSDFDQLPDNIPVTATIADIEEKKGFIVYFVSSLNPAVNRSSSLLFFYHFSAL